MKKFIILFVFLINITYVFSSTILVLPFESEIDYKPNAETMSEALRSELVRSGKVDVVDRQHIDWAINEIKNQSSNYMSQENVKELGHMLNADYVVIGKVQVLTNNSSNVIDKLAKVVGMNEKIEVVVSILDYSTMKILSSSHVNLSRFTDFSNSVSKIARELIDPLEKGKSITGNLQTNIDSANIDMLEGLWSSEIVHEGVIDKYVVNFSGNHKVSISVVSTVSKSGKQTKANGDGRYSFDDNEKILSVTVNNLTGNIKSLKSIKWKSFVNPSSDESSFTISIPINSNENSKKVKAEFWKE